MKNNKYHQRFRLSVPRIIVAGFLVIIMIGTILLALPISSANHTFTDVGTAMFTSLSATCVTGFTIHDTGVYWSVFGQIVILIMVQIGGIGFMSMTVLLSMIIKRSITPRERHIISQSFGLNTNEGTIRLVKKILLGTLIIESAGTVVLATQFIPLFGLTDGLYKSVFHSISAFCNAGIDIMGTLTGEFSGVAYFRYNYIVCAALMILVIAGGIGFIVWDDIYRKIRYRKRLSVYTKFVLIISLILIVLGTLLILMFEYNNPDTIANDSLPDKIAAAMFQSIMTRTTGFTTIDNELLTEPSIAMSILLMFIGGASGSTAGGVKVATFGLLIIAVWQISIGRSEILLFKRTVSRATILKAMTIVMFALILIIISSLAITVIDDTEFMFALYESVSAITTTGITMSLTPELSSISHIILMIMMFLGRIGILTFTYSISTRSIDKSILTYPETYMPVG